MASYKQHDEEQKKYTFTPDQAKLTVLTSFTRKNGSPYTDPKSAFKVEDLDSRNEVVDVISIHFGMHAEVGPPQYRNRVRQCIVC
jgi:hypothetical protein